MACNSNLTETPINSIYKENLNFGYGPVLDDCGDTWNKIGLHTFSGWLNVKTFGAIGDGVADDTVAIQLAVDTGGIGSVIFFPPGTYLVTSTISMTYDSQKIIGSGQIISTISFNPVVDDVCFDFGQGATIQTQCALIGISFDATNNTAHVKTAINLSDIDTFEIYDVSILNWTKAVTFDCVGIHYKGRRNIVTHRIHVTADKPIIIDQNPNSTGLNGQSCIGFTFKNCSLSAHATSLNNSVVKIISGIHVTNLIFDGYQFWNFGRHGLDWTDTGQASAHYSVYINNVLWTGSTDITGYIFFISPFVLLQNLVIQNCYVGGVTRGYYFRNITNGSMLSSAHTNVSAQSLNIDATVNFNFIGCYFTGSLSTPGWINGVLINSQMTGINPNVFLRGLQLGPAITGGPYLRTGTGTPEGAVIGSIGDIFLRTDGGAGTTLYVKQSGAATNTGWIGK